MISQLKEAYKEALKNKDYINALDFAHSLLYYTKSDYYIKRVEKERAIDYRPTVYISTIKGTKGEKYNSLDAIVSRLKQVCNSEGFYFTVIEYNWYDYGHTYGYGADFRFGGSSEEDVLYMEQVLYEEKHQKKKELK